MKEFLCEGWLIMEENFVELSCPAQMDRRVVIDGFLFLRMLVKLEKFCSSEGGM